MKKLIILGLFMLSFIAAPIYAANMSTVSRSDMAMMNQMSERLVMMKKKMMAAKMMVMGVKVYMMGRKMENPKMMMLGTRMYKAGKMMGGEMKMMH